MILEKLELELANNKQLRKFIRQISDCYGKYWPIIIVDGNAKPNLAGHSWHYENKSGHYITYPNAYRRAWGKPIYIGSTRRVEVGSDWLLECVLQRKYIKQVNNGEEAKQEDGTSGVNVG